MCNIPFCLHVICKKFTSKNQHNIIFIYFNFLLLMASLQNASRGRFTLTLNIVIINSMMQVHVLLLKMFTNKTVLFYLLFI